MPPARFHGYGEWLVDRCLLPGVRVHHFEDIQHVLRHFPIAAGAWQAVDTDGFSGARLWRVIDDDRQYCLRRWPEGTNPERVKSINSVLAQTDLPFIPRPVVANSLESVFTHAHHEWTLQPWMPGQSITKLPPPYAVLRNAVQAVALFHQMTASNRFSNDSSKDEFAQQSLALVKGQPPGLRFRVEQATSHLQHDLNGLGTANIPSRLAELNPRRERLIPLFLEVAPRIIDASRSALQWEVPLQPCIRDIHAGHVLFTGDQVTGLIDFDAMRLDSVATDLARMLGSYCSDDRELWDAGLAAYHEIRPLSNDERDLVVHYDRLAVLLTGLQWLDWMLLEGKQFELARVLPRIDATLARLEHLKANLRIGSARLVY